MEDLLNLRFLFTYLFSILIIILLEYILYAWLLHIHGQELVMLIMGGYYINAVYMGIPVTTLVLSYPADLPITEWRDRLIAAIREHQVIVITGETGSGKSTQIPKFCVEAGRGRKGLIGITQPRRIAAITLASRVAEELGKEGPRLVGHKIRFQDRTARSTRIKFMTDGILLAEAQNDRLFRAYDTIIVDEAHERTLNIDFLLGILARTLTVRPELKVIITSATIDPQKFSAAFGDAPIIEVSGRTYPVEVLYRPPENNDEEESEEITYIDQTVSSVDLLKSGRGKRGDILVFMPTESDIRETVQRLEEKRYLNTMVLPLFGRMASGDQQRIFTPAARDKIIVATNVAETSITIPGIKYVIDTGLARIAHYNARSRTRSLPVAPISQASADQRKGRCGRVEAGICIRLYSEEDYLARAPFTPPEILRSNLAEVILRMLFLRLGKIQDFPFVDPPSPAAVKDGFGVLRELGAVDDHHRLTSLGRMMARLPLDPRISRMLLEARQENALREILIVAAALSVQDPRERPLEQEARADQAHALFRDRRSDFVSLLKIWHACWQEGPGIIEEQKPSGPSAEQQTAQYPLLKNGAYSAPVSAIGDNHSHLSKEDSGHDSEAGSDRSTAECSSRISTERADHSEEVLAPPTRVEAGDRENGKIPDPGRRNDKRPPIRNGASPQPGTDRGTDKVSRRSTSQVRKFCREHFLSFRRMREWRDVFEELRSILDEMGDFPENTSPASYEAMHRSVLSGYLSQAAVRKEKNIYNAARNRQAMLFPGSGIFNKGGSWIVASELVHTSRLFARTAANIEPEWLEELGRHLCKYSWSEPHWEKKRGQVVAFEKATLYGLTIVERRKVNFGRINPGEARDIFIRSALMEGEVSTGYSFLDHNRDLISRIEELESRTRRRDLLVDAEILFNFYDQRIGPICDLRTFNKFVKDKGGDEFLKMSEQDLLLAQPDFEALEQFPDSFDSDGIQLPISYKFEPGDEADGVTVAIPVHMLPALSSIPFEWLVPGLVPEKVLALMKGLPKSIRKNFVPVADAARRIGESLPFGKGDFYTELSRTVFEITGVRVSPQQWDKNQLPPHLRMRFEVIGPEGNRLGAGRDLDELRPHTMGRHDDRLWREARLKWETESLSGWNFGTLPDSIQIGIDSMGLPRTAWIGLSSEGEAVWVRLFDNPHDALVSTRAGLMRLYIQVFGQEELAYYTRFDLRRRMHHMDELLIGGVPAILLADGLTPPQDLVDQCDQHQVPLLSTPVAAAQLIDLLRIYLGKKLAPTTTVHGVFLDVLGLGVLITGESGLGKSELALELISRGHGLVADDAVEFSRTAPNMIEGHCPQLLQNLLEVRGLGLLDIRTIFGETSVRRKMRLK
ncbi:MAG: ATP-dependent RNA helicase HrpA, partial [Syntrophobacteraceae bacterium]